MDQESDTKSENSALNENHSNSNLNAIEVSTHLKVLEESEAEIQQQKQEIHALNAELRRAQEANGWLKTKFEESQSEFSKYRAEKAEELVQCQTELAKANIEIGSRSDVGVKFELEQRMHQREKENLQMQLESLERITSTKESAFRSEVESQKRLLELHQNRCTELEKLNADCLAQLNESEHAFQVIGEQHASMKQELDEARNQLASQHFHAAGGDEKDIFKLQSAVQDLTNVLQDKDDLIVEEKSHISRLESEIDLLRGQLGELSEQKKTAETSLAKKAAKCEQLENANVIYAQQSRDLAQQVNALVRELDAVQSGNRSGTLTGEEWEAIKGMAAAARKIPRLGTNGDTSYIYTSENYGSTSIDESRLSMSSAGNDSTPVVYRNVDEMQLVNVKLLQMNRSLKRQLEKAALDYQAKISKADSRALANTMSQIEALQSQIELITSQAQAIKLERDELKLQVASSSDVKTPANANKYMGPSSPVPVVSRSASANEAYEDLKTRFEQTADGYRILEEQCKQWQIRQQEVFDQYDALKKQTVILEERNRDLINAIDLREKESRDLRSKLADEMDKRAAQQAKSLLVEEDLFRAKEELNNAKLQVMNISAEKISFDSSKKQYDEERLRFVSMIEEMQSVHKYTQKQQSAMFGKQNEQISNLENSLKSERERNQEQIAQLQKMQIDKDNALNSLHRQIDVSERQLLSQKEEIVQKQAQIYSLERQLFEKSTTKDDESALEKVLEASKNQHENELKAKDAALEIAKKNAADLEQMLNDANRKIEAAARQFTEASHTSAKRSDDFEKKIGLLQSEIESLKLKNVALEKEKHLVEQALHAAKLELSQSQKELDDSLAALNSQNGKAAVDDAVKSAVAQLNSRWLQKFENAKEHIAGWKHKLEASEVRANQLEEECKELKNALNVSQSNSKPELNAVMAQDSSNKKKRYLISDEAALPAKKLKNETLLVSKPVPSAIEAVIEAITEAADVQESQSVVAERSTESVIEISETFVHERVVHSEQAAALALQGNTNDEDQSSHEPEIEELDGENFSEGATLAEGESSKPISSLVPVITEPELEPEGDFIDERERSSDAMDDTDMQRETQPLESSVQSGNDAKLELIKVPDISVSDKQDVMEHVEMDVEEELDNLVDYESEASLIIATSNEELQEVISESPNPALSKELPESVPESSNDTENFMQNYETSIKDSYPVSTNADEDAVHEPQSSQEQSLNGDEQLAEHLSTSELELPVEEPKDDPTTNDPSEHSSIEEPSAALTPSSLSSIGSNLEASTPAIQQESEAEENNSKQFVSDQKETLELPANVESPVLNQVPIATTPRRIIRLTPSTSKPANQNADASELSGAVQQTPSQKPLISSVNSSPNVKSGSRVIRLNKSSKPTNNGHPAIMQSLGERIQQQQKQTASNQQPTQAQPRQFQRQNSKQLGSGGKGNKQAGKGLQDRVSKQELIEKQREEQRQLLLKSMQARQMQVNKDQAGNKINFASAGASRGGFKGGNRS